MNSYEQQIIKILKDLKENYNISNLKTEFEAEGATLEESKRLKEFSNEIGIELTLKIGGCEAIKDIYDAKNIKVNNIIAPMIESSYALEKFIKSKNSIFNNKQKSPKFYINIETITGYQHLDNIINSPYFDEVSGIVFGRTDMAKSICKNYNVDSNEIYNIAENISKKMLLHKKEMIVGGNISIESINFLKKLNKIYLTKFETRKIVFDASKLLKQENIDIAINKAILFEITWLKYKKNKLKTFTDRDKSRLRILKNRNNL